MQVSLHFNTDGDMILTGSFDSTAKIWEVSAGRCAARRQLLETIWKAHLALFVAIS